MPAATPKTIYDALLKFQQNPPELVKSATNPHFGNAYVPLEQVIEKVLPELHKLGVLVIQAVDNVGPTPALRTTLRHVGSETQVEGTMPLVMDKVTPQAQGSAITYARRYALLSILGLVADADDDAQKASAPVRASRKEAVGATGANEFAPSL